MRIDLQPARAESSASLALSTAVMIEPEPAVATSSTSMTLSVTLGGLLLAYVATVAAMPHDRPHDPHQQPAAMFDPLILTPLLAAVALRLCVRRIARNLQHLSTTP